jgi:acyl CoA:acetate/3-ketoacid CoA transferase beta subunit
MNDFTAREMMAIAAGRFISDGDILFAGTGVA